MPERRIVDQLDQALDTLLARPNEPLAPVEEALAELLVVAAVLRDLPSEDFRARLKSELERKTTMTTTATSLQEGVHTITPYLMVDGAARLIDFVKKAYDAEVLVRVPQPGNPRVIMHAAVSIAGSTLEIADAPKQYRAMPSALHYYVPDADAVYKRTLEAGAASLYAPVDQVYGDREAGVKDPVGNVWYIATQEGESYLPEGLRAITPCVHARGTADLIDFLKRAFDATEVDRYESPDGIVRHARIRFGDSILELGEAHGEIQPMPTGIHLHVPDVDAVYRRALEAGATSLYTPSDKPYGERSGGVIDPFGNFWYVATLIEGARRT